MKPKSLKYLGGSYENQIKNVITTSKAEQPTSGIKRD